MVANSVHTLPGYSVGDVLRAEDLDNLVDPNEQHVFEKNHCAFVRRSDGAFTYAVCKKNIGDGRVTFVVSTSGNVKKISSSKCRGLVKLPISVAQSKQKKPARTSTSRSLGAREGPSIRVHRGSSLPPSNKKLPSTAGVVLDGKNNHCPDECFARSDLSLFEGQLVKNEPIWSRKELTACRNENIAYLSDTEHFVSGAAICSQGEVDGLKLENKMLKKQVKHLQRLLEQKIEMKVLGHYRSSPETDTTEEVELGEYEACQDGMNFLRLQVLNQSK